MRSTGSTPPSSFDDFVECQYGRKLQQALALMAVKHSSEQEDLQRRQRNEENALKAQINWEKQQCLQQMRRMQQDKAQAHTTALLRTEAEARTQNIINWRSEFDAIVTASPLPEVAASDFFERFCITYRNYNILDIMKTWVAEKEDDFKKRFYAALIKKKEKSSGRELVGGGVIARCADQLLAALIQAERATPISTGSPVQPTTAAHAHRVFQPLQRRMELNASRVSQASDTPPNAAAQTPVIGSRTQHSPYARNCFGK